jgi:hypothetical protein
VTASERRTVGETRSAQYGTFPGCDQLKQATVWNHHAEFERYYVEYQRVRHFPAKFITPSGPWVPASEEVIGSGAAFVDVPTGRHRDIPSCVGLFNGLEDLIKNGGTGDTGSPQLPTLGSSSSGGSILPAPWWLNGWPDPTPLDLDTPYDSSDSDDNWQPVDCDRYPDHPDCGEPVRLDPPIS